MITANTHNTTATFDGRTLTLERNAMHPNRGVKRIALSAVTSVYMHRALISPDTFIVETTGGRESVEFRGSKNKRAQWQLLADAVQEAMTGRLFDPLIPGCDD